MGPPTEHIQSLSKKTEQKLGPSYFAPFSTSQINFAIEAMIFYALFSLYQLKQAAPPWCAFKASKESAGNSTRIVPSQLSTQCVKQYRGKIYVLINVVFHIRRRKKCCRALFSQRAGGSFGCVLQMWSVMYHVTHISHVTHVTHVSWRCLSWPLSVAAFSPPRPFSTVTSLCCLITSATNAHSSERESGGGEIWIMEE